jgi:hypothetical protein
MAYGGFKTIIEARALAASPVCRARRDADETSEGSAEGRLRLVAEADC